MIRGPLMGAHPRPCGEHYQVDQVIELEQGSSPPVRGARQLNEDGDVPPGLIPARAGSTRLARHRRHDSRAHPRPCGEHGAAQSPRPLLRGSSPPVRGALKRVAAEGLTGGLIPARAGSTNRSDCPGCTRRAHPRPCGEHRLQPAGITSAWGSSPPVRGAPAVHDPAFRREGLIPARAGSTTYARFFGNLVRAHPRPCGEHLLL